MKGHPALSAQNPQFQLSQEYYLKGLDFTDWYRYYFMIQSVIRCRPEKILEIGVGNRIVEHCLDDYVDEYVTMDLNTNLNPNIQGDLREFQPGLQDKFDTIICSEVLEHMPFHDLKSNLDNMHRYLKANGKVIITLPHRRRSFLFISPSFKHYSFSLPIWTTPTGFYLRFFKNKIVIDPNHFWEIGDMKIRRSDVEFEMKKAGFKVNTFMELLYVDFWLLEKVDGSGTEP